MLPRRLGLFFFGRCQSKNFQTLHYDSALTFTLCDSKVKIVICYCSGSDLFQTVKIFCYMQGLGKFIRRMIGVSFCWCFRLDIDAFPDLEKGGPIESFGRFFFFFFFLLFFLLVTY